MVESIIDIKIKIERALDTAKINDLIRNFVFDLKKYCDVLNYSQIKTEMVKPKEGEKNE